MRKRKKPVAKRLAKRKPVKKVVKRTVRRKAAARKPLKAAIPTGTKPPMTCPKCGYYPVYPDQYGVYKCPRCGKTWQD